MGKRIQNLTLKDLAKKTLYLGYVGENIHTQIIIDCSEVFWDYPDAVPRLNVTPPRGDRYPASQLVKDGDNLIWTITNSDIIYSGSGRIQLRFVDGNEVIKTAVGTTKIDGSIETTGDAPAPLEDWMDRAEETAEQIAETAAATVLENYDELVDDVSSLKSAFEQLHDNVITESAGPSPIVSIADGADGMPMRSVEVAIEPVQDLHGYDAPWPAGGGKNLLKPVDMVSTTISGVTFTIQPDGVHASGTATAGIYYNIINRNASTAPFLQPGTYTLHNTGSQSAGIDIRIAEIADQTLIATAKTTPSTFTLTESKQYFCFIYIISGETLNNVILTPQIESGSSASAYMPYSNICPISGWTGAKVTRTGKNLVPMTATSRTNAGVTYTVNADGSVTINGTATASSWLRGTVSEAERQFLRAGTYHLSGTPSGRQFLVYIIGKYVDGTILNNLTVAGGAYDTGNGLTFTLSMDATVTYQIQVNSGVTVNNITAYPQIELGSATAYEPYQGQTYDIEFPSEAGTVYGGTLDVVSGKLVVDRAMVDLGSFVYWSKDSNRPGVFYSSADAGLRKTRGECVCSAYKWRNNQVPSAGDLSSADNTISLYPSYGDGYIYIVDTAKAELTAEQFKTAMSGVQLVYSLATPVTYQLTNQQVIETLKGVNNVWSDTGDTAITYPADTKMYIDNRINSTRKLLAGIETGFTASKLYAVGDMLIIGDDLYKVTAQIASGATITVGTNVTKTTVAEQLLALANA